MKAEPLWAAEYHRKAKVRANRRYAAKRDEINAARRAKKEAERALRPPVGPITEKACTKCRVVKSLDYFSPSKLGRGGRHTICRVCIAATQRAARQDPVIAAKHCAVVTRCSKARWQRDSEHREKMLAKFRAWAKEQEKDPVAVEKKLAKRRHLYATDPIVRKRMLTKPPGMASYYAMLRHARKRRATPPWVDLGAIKAIYRECDRIAQETGVKHNVDHIVPLANKKVCGLHVPWNLRVITEVENKRKLNRFIPELAFAA